ncbi:Transmembrane amino acid transporter [Blattamonas nauphoetae]|uniref:Transmembrane amino acid transporter n=1 Tax=Blattamonas nauphoetae TaxID=2049346 RepID=A0ABQ9Y4H2_9EUKA|nr:Transmembrane amino acid transporter [Blattamonas nauphoetae]
MNPCRRRNKPKVSDGLPNASMFSAVISLVNSTLGAGMLGIPLAYAKAGLLPAILMHITMAIMSLISFYFLVYVTDAMEQYTLGEIAETIFGLKGVVIIELCNALYCFGSLWAYIILSASFLTSFLRGIGVAATNIFTKDWFIIILVAFFILQPLSWLPTLDSLRFTSFLGTASMSICVFVIIFRYFKPFDPTFHPQPPLIARPSLTLLQTFSTLTFAFGCQQNIPIIQGEIKGRLRKSMHKVSIMAISIVGAFYMFAGVFGYISFTDIFYTNPKSGNVLDLFADRDVFANIARICSLLTVMFCFPVNSLPTRLAIYNIISAFKTFRNRNRTPPIPLSTNSSHTNDADHIESDDKIVSNGIHTKTADETQPLLGEQPKQKRSKKRILIDSLIGSLLVLTAAILAAFVNKVNFVFDLVGSTAGVSIGFIIPAALYIKFIRNPEKFTKLNRTVDPRYPTMAADNEQRLRKILVPIGSRRDQETGEIVKLKKHRADRKLLLGIVVLVFGIVSGGLSLAMAIVYDTGLVKG